MLRKIVKFIARYIYALLSCLYLFTFGFFKARHRKIISDICTHFGYTDTPGEIVIPQIAMSDVVPEETPIQLRQPNEKDGNISTKELIIINKLIKLKNPKALFEIGTFDGRLSLNMAANTSEEAKVYTLDMKQQSLNSTKLRIEAGDRAFINKEEIGLRYKGTDCEKKITQLYGDSATFDFSPYYNGMDFVVVDGSHSYEYALNDSKIALKLLRGGKGVIFWHDYGSPTWPGVTQGLNELFLLTKDFKGLQYIEGTSLVYLNI